MKTINFSDSTIKKITKILPKCLSDWRKDFKDDGYRVKYHSAEEMWNAYSDDIVSDVFYNMRNDLMQYSETGWEYCEERGSIDECLWRLLTDIVKKEFLKISNDYFIWTDSSVSNSNLQDIIKKINSLSKNDRKELINEILKTL